jgi:hypothetical protein
VVNLVLYFKIGNFKQDSGTSTSAAVSGCAELEIVFHWLSLSLRSGVTLLSIFSSPASAMQAVVVNHSEVKCYKVAVVETLHLK